MEGRASLSERAFSFFKKAPPKEFILAPNVYNKNLKNGMPQSPNTQEDTTGKSYTRSQMHQFLLAVVYNKVIFFHLNPLSGQVLIYELDPTFSYKN